MGGGRNQNKILDRLIHILAYLKKKKFISEQGTFSEFYAQEMTPALNNLKNNKVVVKIKIRMKIYRLFISKNIREIDIALVLM